MDARPCRLRRNVVGAPRVKLAALAELHQLLVECGFRRNSRDDPTIVQEEQHEKLPAPAVLSAAPRQLSIVFDLARLRGMTFSERRIAVARLASLLLEAANIAAEELEDHQR